MPIYAFTCKNNHQFERMLKLSEFDKRVRCPECKTTGKRMQVQGFADQNSTQQRQHGSAAKQRFTNW